MARIAYLTDVEGLWHKLEDFVRGNPDVSLRGERIELAPDVIFVFGGDAIDRGPWSRRFVAALLDAKDRYRDRVVLLAGNRDINKLRLRTELEGAPPPRAPKEIAERGGPTLLRWIFEHTMGAKRAFDMRRAELAAEQRLDPEQIDEREVVRSFADDVMPGGPIARYLAASQLAFRHRGTLMVHGAVTDESFGAVPGLAHRIEHADAWIEELNQFYSRSIQDYLEGRRRDGELGWSELVAYQAPIRGTRSNQASVVYGRSTDELGNPALPSRAVIEHLHRAGIHRLVVGHTPSGDTPTVLRGRDLQLVNADNSYSRLERGSRVLLDDEHLEISGRAQLDDGTEGHVRASLGGQVSSSPIGLRDPASGRLIKGALEAGGYLGFRFRAATEIEQLAISERECAELRLVEPTAV